MSQDNFKKPRSRLLRSSSTSSLNSLKDEATDAITELKVSLKAIIQIVKVIQRDDTLEDSTKKRLAEIGKHATNASENAGAMAPNIEALKDRIAEQKDQLNEYKSLIDIYKHELPTKQETVDIIKHTMDTYSSAIQVKLDEVEKLKQSLLDMVPSSIPPATTTTSTCTPNTIHAEVKRVRRQHLPQLPPEYRTLVILPNERNIPGQQIAHEIGRLQLALPTGYIEELTNKRNVAEILCKDQETREKIKAELQNHPGFSNKFAAVNKRLEQYKLILLGAPQGIDAATIKATIADTNNLHACDVNVIRDIKSREASQKNWLFLAPLYPAQVILRKGIVFVGNIRCRIRPFTTVPRCRRCQRFGHQERDCRAMSACDNCSKNHDDSNQCTAQQECINCILHNKHYKTRFSTRHKPSSNSCTAYNRLYTFERERIEALLYPDSQQAMPMYDHHIGHRDTMATQQDSQYNPRADTHYMARGLDDFHR